LSFFVNFPSRAVWASSFIFERTIIREKLRQSQPDVYIDAGTGRFQVLDFMKFHEILQRAEPAKERLRAQLLKVLTAETVALEGGELEAPAPKPKRRLLPRRRRGA
jgi:NTE family protein